MYYLKTASAKHNHCNIYCVVINYAAAMDSGSWCCNNNILPQHTVQKAQWGGRI